MVTSKHLLEQAKEVLNYCKTICKNSEDGYCSGICVRGTGLYFLAKGFAEEIRNNPNRRDILEIAQALGDSSSGTMVDRENNTALMQRIVDYAYEAKKGNCRPFIKKERPIFVQNTNVPHRKNGKSKLFY